MLARKKKIRHITLRAQRYGFAVQRNVRTTATMQVARDYRGQAAPRDPDGNSWGAFCASRNYGYVYPYRHFNADA